MLVHLRRHFLSGLIVWAPLGATLFTLKFTADVFDNILFIIPPKWQPNALLGYEVPGLGFIVALLLIYITGVIVSNYLGNQLFKVWENLLDRIPVVRSLYRSIKQLTESIISAKSGTFDKVFLIEYPRKGLWTIAFQTSERNGVIHRLISDEYLVNLFIPTTPNPTSGYFIMAHPDELIQVDISVDDALKTIVSGGVYTPETMPQITEDQTQPPSAKESL